MDMKNFNEFLLEKKDTGVNKDIIDFASFIYDNMKVNNLKKANFKFEDLKHNFPFLNTWEYNQIDIWINPKYTNHIGYISSTNSIIIFMKALSKSILNHELTHALQSTIDRSVLLIDYENKAVLTQVRNFFTKNAHNIDLLKSILYMATETEMEAFIQSFKKEEKEAKIEILSYVLLLKYFNLTNLISDEQSLRQFVTIWKQYYGESIPFFDRLFIKRKVSSNTLEINKNEVDNFIKRINEKLNKTGTIYMRRLSNQYNRTDVDIEKFIKLLDLAKINIMKNNFKNVLDLSKAKKINISKDRTYDPNSDWDH